MASKALLTLLAGLWVVHAHSADIDTFAEDRAKLKHFPEHIACPIEYWDGSPVAVELESPGDDSSPLVYYRLLNLSAERIVIPGLDQIISFGGTSTTPLVSGRAKGKVKVMMKEDGQWVSVPIPAKVESSRSAFVIASRDGIAFVSGGSLSYIVDGVWTITALPPVPEFYKGVDPGSIGSEQFCTSSGVSPRKSTKFAGSLLT